MQLTVDMVLYLIATILFAISSFEGVQIRLDLFKLAFAFLSLSLIV